MRVAASGASAADSFGALLRRYREQAGLTQERLADLAGLSANAVSSLERGARRFPHPHTRDALSAALRLSPDQRRTLDSAVEPRRQQPPQLPAAPTPLVGREAEIDTVTELLSGHRVITLSGPGGVGKTRLGLAVAEQVTTNYPDGVAFVPLAPQRSAADVLPAIAERLDLRELGARNIREVLLQYVGSRKILLVLDNFEHLTDAATDVAELLAAAPGIRILVTSRAPLRIQGEHVYPVPALDPRAAAGLFVERATQASGATVLADPDTVAEICARLDNLPLAIELAAARARLLTPTQLLASLDRVMSVLVDGARDAPVRHQALRHTVEWSYALLDEPARQLLRVLSVFADGWTLDAATAVAGIAEREALTLHEALLDNSLIVRDLSSTEPRFTMLETIRAFAAEKVPDNDPAHERHASFYGETVRACANSIWKSAQAPLFDRLEADHENTRVGLRWLLEHGRFHELADACFGSWLYWIARGHMRDPLSWADQAIQQDDLPTAGRAVLQLLAGQILLAQGRYEQAILRFTDAAQLSIDVDDLRVRCSALPSWAEAELAVGQIETAAQLLDEAEVLAEQLDQPQEIVHAAVVRAHVFMHLGQMREADAVMCARLPDPESTADWCHAVALGTHARIVTELGDRSRATSLLNRAIDVLDRLGDTWGMAHQLTHAADAATVRGDHATAALLYGYTDVLVEQTGAHLFPCWQELSDRCRSGLDPDAHWLLHRGSTLTMADAIRLATDESSDLSGQLTTADIVAAGRDN